MSYREYYNKTITVSGTESYTYPASESGGTGSVTVHIDVPIDIEIFVDTAPFDQSVDKAETHLDLLTETVVASEAAEVLAINECAAKISRTVVNGFFSYIKYDISQQISEYRPFVEAKFIELAKLHESCVAKKTQMSSDFARIAARYTGIFEDLDRETNSGVRSLNHEAFAAVSQISGMVTCSSDNGLLNTATIAGLDCGNTSSLLFSSNIKNRAFQLLRKAKKFLTNDRNLKIKLKSILISQPAKNAALKFLPVIYLVVANEKQKSRTEIKFDTDYTGFQRTGFNDLIERSLQPEIFNWEVIDGTIRQRLENFLQAEIAKNNPGSESHKNRVSEMIWLLWNNNKTLIQSNQNHA